MSEHPENPRLLPEPPVIDYRTPQPSPSCEPPPVSQAELQGAKWFSIAFIIVIITLTLLFIVIMTRIFLQSI